MSSSSSTRTAPLRPIERRSPSPSSPASTARRSTSRFAAHFTALEERPTAIHLKGINQRDNPAWFTIRRAPAHGRLYHSNVFTQEELAKLEPSATPFCDETCLEAVLLALQPHELTAFPANATDIGPCPPPDGRWSCASIIYAGERDWFSHPTEAAGVSLNVSDDRVVFFMQSSSEESAESTTTVQVDNV